MTIDEKISDPEFACSKMTYVYFHLERCILRILKKYFYLEEEQQKYILDKMDKKCYNLIYLILLKLLEN